MTQQPSLAYDEREDRLPQWVRSKLTSLRNALKEETKRADILQKKAGSDKAPITARDYVRGTCVDLTDFDYVRFLTGQGRVGDYIDVNLHDGSIILTGNNRLVVRASAANRIMVRLDR